jgi:hypothetical protein
MCSSSELSPRGVAGCIAFSMSSTAMEACSALGAALTGASTRCSSAASLAHREGSAPRSSPSTITRSNSTSSGRRRTEGGDEPEPPAAAAAAAAAAASGRGELLPSGSGRSSAAARRRGGGGDGGRSEPSVMSSPSAMVGPRPPSAAASWAPVPSSAPSSRNDHERSTSHALPPSTNRTCRTPSDFSATAHRHAAAAAAAAAASGPPRS